jgi:hypothetical protein
MNSKYNNLELAIKFAEVSQKFLSIASSPKNILDFYRGDMSKTACGTVACHGGWAAVILNSTDSCYLVGAADLSHYLGFWGKYAYSLWAAENPTIWGNTSGEWMFTSYGHRAFDFIESDQCTLLDIAQWYYNISRRLLVLHQGGKLCMSY